MKKKCRVKKIGHHIAGVPSDINKKMFKRVSLENAT